VIASTASKEAKAIGWFPKDDPGTGGPACFGRGTLILTPRGEVAVENLAVGDLVTTAHGSMPVKWIGRQTYASGETDSLPSSAVPVRIARFAIDDQTPQRDLYVSQEHSLLIDGVLIPAKYLVNGRSITFDVEARNADIEYFSIELDTHEVIFAEGVATETFRYAGDHVIAWDNLAGYEKLYGTHQVLPPVAPIYRYRTTAAEMRGLLRLAASRFVDVRDPVQLAYDRIAARAVGAALAA